MARITLDPVTRIEGHLRIDVEVNGNRVSKAWSSAQMWRGIETRITSYNVCYTKLLRSRKRPSSSTALL